MAVTAHKSIDVIIRRLDRDVVARMLVDGFRADIPGYARLPRQVIEDQIIPIARQNIDLCFDGILLGRPLTRAELEPFRSSARDRASEGMPLEDLLHAYRLGGRVGWRAIAGAARPGEEGALLEAAELVMAYIDGATSAVAQAYLEERQELVSEEERTARELFDALMRGREPDPRLIRGTSKRRFSLGPELHAFVVLARGRGGRGHGDIAAAMRRDGTLALTEGDRVAGVLPPEHRARLRGLPGLVVVADPVGRGALEHTLAEVRAVSELALDRGLEGDVAIGDFPLELLLLASPAHAARIARTVISPLGPAPGDDGRTSELFTTLEALVESDFDRRRTAERLHVHPNTLDYRMRRVRELTGLDPRKAESIALMVLAVRQAGLARH